MVREGNRIKIIGVLIVEYLFTNDPKKTRTVYYYFHRGKAHFVGVREVVQCWYGLMDSL